MTPFLACNAVCTLPESSRGHRPGVVLGSFAALVAENRLGLDHGADLHTVFRFFWFTAPWRGHTAVAQQAARLAATLHVPALSIDPSA